MKKRARSEPLLKIRTVTVGVTFERGNRAQWFEALAHAAKFNAAAEAAYTAAGFEVQTVRVATNSFEEWCDIGDADTALSAFRALDAELERLDIKLFNAGPATSAAALELAPKIVALGPRSAPPFALRCARAHAPHTRDHCRTPRCHP